MIPAIVVFCYLAIVLYIGIFAFRKSTGSRDDFFLANRSLGPYIFVLSLFGTNMTAFAILGSSGLAYQRGIGVYGLMASSSGFVIPLTLFFIGTRLWHLGKKFGHLTQVQYFRDRWECSFVGTVIFALTAVMLVPYLIIGTMGGGTTLESISTVMGEDGKPVMVQVYNPDGTPAMEPVMVPKVVDGKPTPQKVPKLDENGNKVLQPKMEPKHWVSYEVGAALVALVVMSYVFFGGMRGTAWVNSFQTLLFLSFGAAAFIIIGSKQDGGFSALMDKMAANPRTAALLTRERIPMEEFFSYTFIPLSSIMFPHIAIMCMTAEKVTHFKKTVIFYPLCIMAIWLPCVYFGVIGAELVPGLSQETSDDVIPRMLRENTNVLLAGILGAGIMACVMASDSQILALSTMFSEDIFRYYGGKEKFGERVQVWTGRVFIIIVTLIAYLIALELKDKEGIFELAIRFAFSGFAALAPVMLAALFWKRSNKWGALAATLWVAFSLGFTWWLFSDTELIKPPPGKFVDIPGYGGIFQRSFSNVLVYGFLPVMPMVIGSALLMIGVSLLTPPPSRATIEKYFPPKTA
ncbi:MAG TPA: sodium:solute symporter family protein [Planctomycetota bacterium]|nr:sodium:solute symporter family protein [Planctomycetota bacterium]